jgi:autotransporter strand-loop-strand O-heptosyltransferase
MWSKLNRRYLGNYFVEIWDKGFLKKRISFLEHIKGKKVFISFESKSLGDTIAWIPYCLEFKKKYDCEVVVSTFLNFLFEGAYPELTFVGRGKTVHNIIAMLEIGWFWNKDKEPQHPATIPLQKSATNILALEYNEIVTDLDFLPKQRPIEDKYITISTFSTSALKHWDKSNWQMVVDYFVNHGYKVVEVSKDNSDLSNIQNIEDVSLENTMNYIHHSDLFIGLSSGLSWLSWALKKKVVMISNFTTKDHEFQSNCIRITDESICNGCWNNPMFKFDKGNWWYCPEHEDTPKQFECHKRITPQKVIQEIQKAGI